LSGFIKMYKLLIFTFSIFFLGISLNITHAQDGGYAGLFAPSPSVAVPDSSSTGGFMLPSEEKRRSAKPSKKQEPAGYYGLIEGKVEDNFIPERDIRVATPLPNVPKIFIPKNGEDVKYIAGQYQNEKKQNELLKERSKKIELTSEQMAMLNKGGQKINGKDAAAYFAEQRIKQMFYMTEDKKLSNDEKYEAKVKLKRKLVSMADRVRYKVAIPDKSYKMLGMPDVYIRMRRTSNKETLNMINSKIKLLADY